MLVAQGFETVKKSNEVSRFTCSNDVKGFREIDGDSSTYAKCISVPFWFPKSCPCPASILFYSDPILIPRLRLPPFQRSSSVPIHLVLLAFQDTADTSPDQLGALSGIDRGPNTGTLVVVNNRASLGVISVQSLPEGTDVVVGTLDEGLAGDVVGHGLLRGVDCKK